MNMIFNKRYVWVLLTTFGFLQERKLTCKVRTLIDFSFNLLHFMQSFYPCNLEREMMEVEVTWVDSNSRKITIISRVWKCLMNENLTRVSMLLCSWFLGWNLEEDELMKGCWCLCDMGRSRREGRLIYEFKEVWTWLVNPWRARVNTCHHLMTKCMRSSHKCESPP